MGQAQRLSTEQLRERLHHALTLWHKGNGDGAPLEEFLLYQRAYADQRSVRRATNQILTGLIAQLAEQIPEEATILRLRFAEEESAQAVANRLSLSEGNIFKKQREAIEHLADILCDLEERARAELQSRYWQRIEPASYSALFGVEAAQARLIEILTDPNPPWLISIEGIGGIGKTTLAHALVACLIDEGFVSWRHYSDLAWITAQQQRFNAGGALQPSTQPALPIEELIAHLAEQLLPEDERRGQGLRALETNLGKRFKQTPHLVVIDNLETKDDLRTLIDVTQRWAGPSKFVLTSRRSLFDTPGVYPYRLPELSLTDSLTLIRHEARLRNLSILADAPAGQLEAIYRIVGGNPLALRLVVGQIFVHSLDHVLADLKGAQGRAAEQLYTYIYRRAWDHLDETARQVLLIMPLASEAGADLEWLAAIADEEPCYLRPVLEQLIEL
ncbi:MAG: hypothetical protein KF893_24980, partial [Caldilineaceae bacterium]|nr:hypothetical protein [Caldilineaceae bacterium]